VDVITNAFERARTRGRGGKGSVIAVAAGKLDSKRKRKKAMGWGRLDIHAALRRALHE
jgi:hypothetical protein